jgi:SAM-dependent methyltransferase
MSETTNWWATFFSGLALESQRSMYPPEHTAADASFLEKVLCLGPGAKVADVPCGNGRISLELARRGCLVTGVDLCGELIDDAKQAASAKELNCTFEKRDIRDLPWPSEFDAVFCFGNSFAYLDHDGNEQFLRAVHRTLKPGGHFALETGLAAESILTNFPSAKRSWHALGDTLMLREANYDPERGEVSTDYQFLRGGVIEKKRAVYHVYLYRELEQMLRQIGFSEMRAFGSQSEEPYVLGARILYLIATKPG